MSDWIQAIGEVNIVLRFGNDIFITFFVERTLLNRFKYWMLCLFFPFKIESWDRKQPDNVVGNAEL